MQWVCAVAIGGGSLIHLVYADIAQYRLNKETEEVIRLLEESSDGQFYYDISYPVADAALFKTNNRQFHEKIPKSFLELYYGKRPIILPTALKGFSRQKATPSKYTSGAMIYNGWIVTEDTVDMESVKIIDIYVDGNQEVSSRFRQDRFRADDGDYYILITPHLKVLNPALKVEDLRR